MGETGAVGENKYLGGEALRGELPQVRVVAAAARAELRDQLLPHARRLARELHARLVRHAQQLRDVLGGLRVARVLRSLECRRERGAALGEELRKHRARLPEQRQRDLRDARRARAALLELLDGVVEEDLRAVAAE